VLRFLIEFSKKLSFILYTCIIAYSVKFVKTLGHFLAFFRLSLPETAKLIVISGRRKANY
jgi:hypothetical protein